MKRKLSMAIALLVISMASGCAGMRDHGTTFVAHGECFRLFGFEIPNDDMKLALDQVPPNAVVTNISSTSADWSSFRGILFNIIGFHSTKIGGVK